MFSRSELKECFSSQKLLYMCVYFVVFHECECECKSVYVFVLVTKILF